LNGPSAVHVDYGLAVQRLWVADRQNRRVLRFEDVYSANLAEAREADGVLGQPDFDGVVSGSTDEYKFNPSGIALDSQNGILWVADGDRHRVLGFSNPGSKPDFGEADFVIGQPDFESDGSGHSASGLQAPLDLRSLPDGRLCVLDQHRRLLLFPASALASPLPGASVVLGQSAFTGSESGTGPRRLASAGSLGVDGDGNEP